MMHHRVVLVPVMTVTATVVAKRHAGEEDDRDDEDDPGDDRYPRGGFEHLGGLVDRGFARWRWCYRGGSPRGWGFRKFTHETNDACVNTGDGYGLLKYQL
jgi:hypothetical protein